jgi:hypothetical protein
VLIAQASVTAAAVAAALPTGVAVSLEGSEGGQVRVRVSGALFGLGASVRATAGPSDGRLIVTPKGSLLQAFNLTLFSSPHIYIEGVGATVQSERPLTYRLTLSARTT